jgi:succinyl-diaminopimelate desuccinylase
MIHKLADTDHQGVISLIQELVKLPTRGGIDPYDNIMTCVSEWLINHDLCPRRLHDTVTNDPVAVVCDVAGGHPGPRYVLDACLDTAPFGELTTWQHAPTSAAIEDGWLYGRGAADSKAAIAIFMHLATHIKDHAQQLHGTVTLLFDADEHTGNFGGAKRYFGEKDAPTDIHGVMIGYPGMDELVIGGRGFLRVNLIVRGEAGHTGSDRIVTGNAIEHAAELVRALATRRVPGPTDAALGIAPKVTVTAIAGGQGYSIIPDVCTVSVDVRLTTDFNESAAKNLITNVVKDVDEQRQSFIGATTVAFHESWPAYQLSKDSVIRVALQNAAKHHLHSDLTAKVTGPSNIGNYLAKLGIDATAGLGVRYEGLHATNERIDLATIPAVQATYHEAHLRLFSGQ